MLTDDEITRELGAAFRAETAGLSYTGRRRPPRRAAVPLSAGAAAAVVAASALGVWVHGGPAASPSVPALTSATVRLDGLTLHYQRRAGQPSPIRVDQDVRAVPAGARPVPLAAGASAKAWVGKDPASGNNAVYVQSPVRFGGKIFALLSSSLTQGQLIAILNSGS
jgi:hypothetical protein